MLRRASSVWRAVPWVALIFATHLVIQQLVTPGTGSDGESGVDRVSHGPGSNGATGSDPGEDEKNPDKADDDDTGTASDSSAPEFRPVDLVVETKDDIESIEDPVALFAAGEHWLEQGDRKLARACFEAAVAREEINRYQDYADTRFGEAVVLERMGEHSRARWEWRQSFRDDVISAMYFLGHFSTHPDRDALLQEAVDYTRDMVERAKAGESVHFYTTSKGASRKLQVVTPEDAIARMEAGEVLRYAYIEKLDLTNRTWPNRVGCKRCVVEELLGYGSRFEEQLDFHGIVLEKAHLGKYWTGEVNRSKPIAAGRFHKLYLGRSVVLGDLNLDSLKVDGRVLNLPMALVRGGLDLRNADIRGTLEMRYTHVDGPVSMRGAELHEAAYLGYGHMGGIDMARVLVHKSPLLFNATRFTGPVELESCDLHRGATFEFARFDAPFRVHQCRFYDRLNLSRARLADGLSLTRCEATDMDVFGIEIHGDADFADNTFTGNVRFAVDELTRRKHLGNPGPLHKLYKQYQGDLDAEEDLTSSSQYGVTSVDDLTAVMHGSVSFANSIFSKFVSFEGVRFGEIGKPEKQTSFYNAQFFGEAHFERSRHYTTADFRTISGHEISFNGAEFHDDWILDDANVPGRLTSSAVDLLGDATLSFYGAQIDSFNVTFRQLLDDDREHRMFYEQCAAIDPDDDAIDAYSEDSRLADASWDPERDAPIRDPDTIRQRTHEICLDRAIAEFVLLKDSFNKRSMNEESDWAYWHLRHYKNERDIEQADGVLASAAAWGQWLLFEKAFGWGVHLSNLLWTGLAVILIFMGLQRLLCPDLKVDLDDETTALKDLPLHAQFMLSLHCFLGRARDWRAKESNRTWKVLYITELVLGIILITFFIGAYTRMVLR